MDIEELSPEWREYVREMVESGQIRGDTESIRAFVKVASQGLSSGDPVVQEAIKAAANAQHRHDLLRSGESRPAKSSDVEELLDLGLTEFFEGKPK